MLKLLTTWWMIAILLACFVFSIFALFPVPMFDGVFYYNNDLVHFQQDSKVALSYFFGVGIESEIKNTIIPSFKLKPVGIALMILIHLGFPLLIGLRIKYSRERKKLDESEH